jgi:hypothetical protein
MKTPLQKYCVLKIDFCFILPVPTILPFSTYTKYVCNYIFLIFFSTVMPLYSYTSVFATIVVVFCVIVASNGVPTVLAQYPLTSGDATYDPTVGDGYNCLPFGVYFVCVCVCGVCVCVCDTHYVHMDVRFPISFLFTHRLISPVPPPPLFPSPPVPPPVPFSPVPFSPLPFSPSPLLP